MVYRHSQESDATDVEQLQGELLGLVAPTPRKVAVVGIRSESPVSNPRLSAEESQACLEIRCILSRNSTTEANDESMSNNTSHRSGEFLAQPMCLVDNSQPCSSSVYNASRDANRSSFSNMVHSSSSSCLAAPKAVRASHAMVDHQQQQQQQQLAQAAFDHYQSKMQRPEPLSLPAKNDVTTPPYTPYQQHRQENVYDSRFLSEQQHHHHQQQQQQLPYVPTGGVTCPWNQMTPPSRALNPVSCDSRFNTYDVEGIPMGTEIGIFALSPPLPDEDTGLDPMQPMDPVHPLGPLEGRPSEFVDMNHSMGRVF